MWHLVTTLFTPPPMPEIDLPYAVKSIPGVRLAISKAFELAYYRGVLDGFLAGALLALIFIPPIGRQLKGRSHGE